MMKQWMLLLLLMACAMAPAFAQGDPGGVYTTWRLPSCYQYQVVFAGGPAKRSVGRESPILWAEYRRRWTLAWTIPLSRYLGMAA